jgi:hypothetical protein
MGHCVLDSTIPGFAKATEEQMRAAGTAMRRAHEAKVFMDVGSGKGERGKAVRNEPRPTMTQTRDAGHHGFEKIAQDPVIGLFGQ